MKQRILLLALLLLAVSQTSSYAQFFARRNVTRPCLPRCVPNYDYDVSKRSVIKVALSDEVVFLDDITDEQRQMLEEQDGPRVVVRSSDSEVPEHQVKLFQWDQRSITIDHCSIADMVVQLDRSGNWTVNLRAEQNPDTNSYNPSFHIKRNKFFVRVRLYGDPADGIHRDVSVGQPVLGQFGISEFWVENGRPKTEVQQGALVMGEGAFDMIKRAEIEFYYVK